MKGGKTLCDRKQTLVAEERARELGKLRAHAHDLLAAEQLLRNECSSTANNVATQVNNDGLTLEHLQKHTHQKKKTTKKYYKKKDNKTKKLSFFFFQWIMGTCL